MLAKFSEIGQELTTQSCDSGFW